MYAGSSRMSGTSAEEEVEGGRRGGDNAPTHVVLALNGSSRGRSQLTCWPTLGRSCHNCSPQSH